MNTTEQQAITYENPPIHEIVCGVLFDPIKGLQTSHFGILWQKFRPDFSRVENHIPIAPVSQEDFDNQTKLPPQRIWFVHKDDNAIIQVQFNRFLHNWRKIRPDDKYLGYETVVENFERYLSGFQDFLAEENLENLVARHYELTYIDHILQNQGWETLNNLEKVFPSFASLKSQNMFSTAIREINWQTVFSLPNDSGQLTLSIRSGQRTSDNLPLLRIEFTAHSNQPYKPRREWFDYAHEVILKHFSNLMSDEIQERWGRRT